MSDKKLVESGAFSIEFMIEIIDNIEQDKKCRMEFEQFYKSFVVNSVENTISNKKKLLKNMINESEVYNMMIRERIKGLEETSKAIYAMGRFSGAYDVFNTWCKMYEDNTQFEQTIKKILLKKHMQDILYCVKENPGIQNKKILEMVKIKPNHLSELTNELIIYQIFNRYRIGKNTFYELTPRARDYFAEKEKREMRVNLSKQKMAMYELFEEDNSVTNYWNELFMYSQQKKYDIEISEGNKKYYGEINEQELEIERRIYNV